MFCIVGSSWTLYIRQLKMNQETANNLDVFRWLVQTKGSFFVLGNCIYHLIEGC